MAKAKIDKNQIRLNWLDLPLHEREQVIALEKLDQSGVLTYKCELNPEQTYHFCKKREKVSYPGNLSDLVLKIHEIMPAPYYIPTSENLKDYTFDVGKDYSRVLWVKMNRIYDPEFKDFDYDELFNKIKVLADEAGADEIQHIHKELSTGFFVRIWWD